MAETSKAALTLERAETPPAWIPASPQEWAEWIESHNEAYAMRWRTLFHVLGGTDLLPQPRVISVQTTGDEHYRSEGRLRQSEHHCYFCYTLSGAGRFKDGNGEQRVARGQGFLMEIDDPQVQYYYAPEEGEAWRFLAFEFDGLPSKSMVRGLTERFGGCFTLDPQTPVLCRLLAYAPKAYHPSERLESPGEAFHGIADINLADGAELVTELLITLASTASAVWETDREAALVRQALTIIADNAQAGLRVTELAEKLGISREHLARTFRRQLGRSPSQIIRERQTHSACVMLKQTDLTVREIATRLGYGDDTNFIHAFRQMTQMTPHQFRRQGSLSSWFHSSTSRLPLLG